MSSVYEQVTDNIVHMLEQGDVPPWRKDWTGEPMGLPYNGVTNHQYKGINIWNLMIAGWAKDYGSNQWATYKQWSSVGGQVRKGERSTVAVFFKPILRTDDSGKDYQIHIARSFHVFNKDQVDIDMSDNQPEPEEKIDIELYGHSLEMANSLGVNVCEGKPAYNRLTDAISMPMSDMFTSAEAYYATMAHECSHATGHRSRLDRTFGKRFGDDDYAMEELTAELSAAYLCASYGIPYDLQQHASYLDAWIKRLKTDVKAIFAVAAASQRAADYISDSVKSLRLVNEQESELGRLMSNG
jgi:antirestriction protein ArdC